MQSLEFEPQLLERYLEGKMPEGERSAFEEAYHTNSQFAEEANAYVLGIKSLIVTS